MRLLLVISKHVSLTMKVCVVLCSNVIKKKALQLSRLVKSVLFPQHCFPPELPRTIERDDLLKSPIYARKCVNVSKSSHQIGTIRFLHHLVELDTAVGFASIGCAMVRHRAQQSKFNPVKCTSTPQSLQSTALRMQHPM